MRNELGVEVMIRCGVGLMLAWFSFLGTSVGVDAAEALHFGRDVEPILRKYCVGCHNDTDREGNLSLASYRALLEGAGSERVMVAENSDESKLLKVLRATDETRMPPEDKPRPSADEIATIAKWIDEGAAQPILLPLTERLRFPKLLSDPLGSRHATALCKVDESLVSIGRFGRVDFMQLSGQQILWSANNFPGKVNQLRLTNDGKLLVVASGIAGLGGQVSLIDWVERKTIASFEGHDDTIYCAAVSPDGHYVATGSYDRVVHLWDIKQRKIARSFTGHNGAIYDLDFDKSGKVLATASGDQTIKLWNLATGERLDTLGQGEGEMLAVRFAPDGATIIGGGADRQLRMWKLISTDKPTINPMLVSTFAHESSITRIEFAMETRQVVSIANDRTIKTWSLDSLQPVAQLGSTRDVPVGVSVLSKSQCAAIDLAGNFQQVQLVPMSAKSLSGQNLVDASEKRLTGIRAVLSLETQDSISEIEPNDQPAAAMLVQLPTKIQGKIQAPVNSGTDVDLFNFRAEKGESWIFEVVADRNKSPLDSCLEVVDTHGHGVLRTQLQAVRETYFTFRGKDSSTSGDFRLHNWEEMELNEYLYSDGEVVKLWMYPRGPDSGYIVYPGFGERFTFFDTTPISHALGAPAYIVREISADQPPLPNGLPMFPVYFSNDDDASRQIGRDSRLTFSAPGTGEFIVRVKDARGFGGDEFKYELIVRRPQPDFEISVKGNEMQMPVGSGREWQVTAKRLDGLEEAIEVHLEGLPEGFEATNPVVIEPGQLIGYGCVFATDQTPLLPNQDTITVGLRAKSVFEGAPIEHQLSIPLTLRLTDKPEVQVVLADAKDSHREISSLVIRPGQTISARVIAKRNGFDARIPLGKEDAGRNLPHGSYVDNIGLNGLLIVEGTSEREFFITASKTTAPQQRFFHIKSETPGAATSRPILLTVVGDENVASK